MRNHAEQAEAVSSVLSIMSQSGMSPDASLQALGYILSTQGLMPSTSQVMVVLGGDIQGFRPDHLAGAETD